MPVREAITSRAHNWVQSLPLKESEVKCTRCEATTRIGNWDIGRCTPHTEFKDSGYLP